MKQHHITKPGAAQPRKTSEAENLAHKLIAAKRWRSIVDESPPESGQYCVLVTGVWDRERSFPAIGTYDQRRDCWRYHIDSNTIGDSGSLVSHWLPVKLPPMPANLNAIEEVV